MAVIRIDLGLLSIPANFVSRFVSLILLRSFLTWNIDAAMAEWTAYCSAYCDIYDNLIPSSSCESNDRPIYCCGTTYNKTCCSDLSAMIDNAEETVCGHSWIYYQWSLIYGLVAVLMVILMIVICCICCRGYQMVSRRRSDNSGSRQERGEGNENDPQTLGFDPTCEYAFEPPRYETLPKDPPKYSEVFSTSEHDNAAFTPEEPLAVEVMHSRTDAPSLLSAEEANSQRMASGEATNEVIEEREATRRTEPEVVVTVEEEGIRNETGTDVSSSSSTSSSA